MWHFLMFDMRKHDASPVAKGCQVTMTAFKSHVDEDFIFTRTDIWEDLWWAHLTTEGMAECRLNWFRMWQMCIDLGKL